MKKNNTFIDNELAFGIFTVCLSQSPNFSGGHYNGAWHTNKKHGYGTFVLSNGNILEGEFRNDNFIGDSDISSQERSAKIQAKRSQSNTLLQNTCMYIIDKLKYAFILCTHNTCKM